MFCGECVCARMYMYYVCFVCERCVYGCMNVCVVCVAGLLVKTNVFIELYIYP